MQQYFQTFKAFADFSGRATRKEFWVFGVINFFIFIIIPVIGMMLGSIEVVDTILMTALFSFVVFITIPTIAVTVRRIHDTGRSGWWLLSAVIPFAGWLVLFMLMILNSQKSKNEYGGYIKAKKWSFFTMFLIFIGILFFFIFIGYFADYEEDNESEIKIENIEDNEEPKMGVKYSIDMEDGKLIGEKVVVNVENTVQEVNESVSMYCGVQKRRFDFVGETYYLAYSAAQPSGTFFSMEFVPKGETLERFNKMIIIQCNTINMTHGQAMVGVMKTVQERNGNKAKTYSISTGENKLGFSFVVGEDSFFKEWNMISFSPMLKNRQGYITFGMSVRDYKNDDDSKFKDFNSEAEKLDNEYKDELMNFDLVSLTLK